MIATAPFTRLRARLRAVQRHQWIIACLSVTMTGVIVITFLVENRFGYLPRDPIIAYFKTWEDGRSRAEAIALQEEEKRLAAEADAIAAELDVGSGTAGAP